LYADEGEIVQTPTPIEQKPALAVGKLASAALPSLRKFSSEVSKLSEKTSFSRAMAKRETTASLLLS
jgi:hypothetical protein